MLRMKDSGIEWIGQIPADWNVIRGKHFLVYIQKPVRADDGVITCFRDGEVTLRSNRREDGFTMSDKEIGYQGIDVGDLVVHGMDGFAGSIGISDSRGKASPVLIVLNTDQYKRYIMYLLRSMAYSEIFLAMATGIRVRSCDLRWNKLAGLFYSIPPLYEQKQIADFLDDKCAAIDRLTANIQRQMELLEQYKRSVITEAVTKGLDPAAEMKDSGIEWIGQIPADWKIVKTKDLFYRSRIKACVDEPVVLSLARDAIKVRDISTNEGQVALSYYEYNVVQPGDLLLNPMDLYSGANCNVSEVSGVISPAYMNLRSHKKINTKFFDYYFKTQYWSMAMFAHGRGVSFDNRWTMNFETLMNYKLLCPGLNVQNQITSFLDDKCAAIDSVLAKKQEQLARLENYKKSLIYEYVTGKKEVACAQ